MTDGAEMQKRSCNLLGLQAGLLMMGLLAALLVGCSSAQQEQVSDNDVAANDNPANMGTSAPAVEQQQAEKQSGRQAQQQDSAAQTENRVQIGGGQASNNQSSSGQVGHVPTVNAQTVNGQTVNENSGASPRVRTLPVAPSISTGTKKSETLFEGWQKPHLVLLISGRQHGYIEPCGCTGLENQKGGLARRHTLAKQLASRNWPLAAVDVGNQVRRLGRQAEIKFQITVEGFRKINYQAVGFGPDDLLLSPGELVAVTAGTEAQQSMFVCANAAVLDRSLTARYRVVQIGKKKLGITAVLGTAQMAKIKSSDIILQSPEEGLREAWTQLQQQQCDYYVLLAHADIDETKKLAQKFSEFDVIITAGGGEEPAFQPQRIGTAGTVLIQTGAKGMFVGVIGFFDDLDKPLRYQRVPMDDRFADSPEMMNLLASYQQELQRAGLAGLGLNANPHPSGKLFVGSQACADCHSSAFEVWKKTGHADATDSLVHPGQRSEIPRHYDPECLSCHVTGWNPQQFYPYRSGYLGLEKSPLLHASGCENCHGPGSAHVAMENGDVDADDRTMARLRAAMRLPLDKAEKKCIECHDLDNSLEFHKPGGFEEYWKRVEHKGLE